jgi:hypothetical protein
MQTEREIEKRTSNLTRLTTTESKRRKKHKQIKK